jgi:hypothetical protein
VQNLKPLTRKSGTAVQGRKMELPLEHMGHSSQDAWMHEADVEHGDLVGQIGEAIGAGLRRSPESEALAAAGAGCT